MGRGEHRVGGRRVNFRWRRAAEESDSARTAQVSVKSFLREDIVGCCRIEYGRGALSIASCLCVECD